MTLIFLGGSWYIKPEVTKTYLTGVGKSKIQIIKYSEQNRFEFGLQTSYLKKMSSITSNFPAISDRISFLGD